MNLNLENGVSLKIEGELGKNQTLSVDALIKIAQSLQDLIITIAQYDLPTDEAIDLNNFKIELTDYSKGSSIPTFALSSNPTLITTSDVYKQREDVSKKLNSLLKISDKGTYYDLKQLYPEPQKRNHFVEKLYNFNNSFKTSPVSIYEKGNKESFYRIQKFKPAVKKSLLVEIKDSDDDKRVEEGIAKVRVFKKGQRTTKTKVQELILSKNHSLSYSPDIININDKQYILKFPLRCLFEKEDDYYLIEHEALDIVGTGLTQNEAENNFNEEFDFLFTRLNQLDDKKLSNRLIGIKVMINSYVKEVI